jgi:hypothetical protein
MIFAAKTVSYEDYIGKIKLQKKKEKYAIILTKVRHLFSKKVFNNELFHS